MSNKKTKPNDVEELPVAPPEPTHEELIARRKQALEELGLRDERVFEVTEGETKTVA